MISSITPQPQQKRIPYSVAAANLNQTVTTTAPPTPSPKIPNQIITSQPLPPKNTVTKPPLVLKLSTSSSQNLTSFYHHGLLPQFSSSKQSSVTPASSFLHRSGRSSNGSTSSTIESPISLNDFSVVENTFQKAFNMDSMQKLVCFLKSY